MLVERFRPRIQSELADADCFHRLDESVLQDLIRHGPSSGITRRIVTLSQLATDAGSERIVFTCWSTSPAIDAARQTVNVPILEIDDPLYARVLGPNVWHDTPAAAMAMLEELEETARLWLLVRPTPLDEAQIADLRSAFGASW
jgi:ribulose-5-phosphate 4-epimerase/fuculose-1-phosphate aldolase